MFKNKFARIIFSLIILVTLFVILAFSIPFTREKILWHVDQWKVSIDYALHPPEESVFIPQATSNEFALPTPTPTPSPSPTFTLQDSELTNTPQIIPTSTALPTAVDLEGIKYEDQHGLWNYCAPANLAMQLSYWGWQGDRRDTGIYLKPFDKDKNVMPYEMVNYVNDETDLKAIVRSGGNIPLLKKLIANGFPVLVEKGVFIRDLNGKVSWMGHYAVVNGYDDSQAAFISQDSYFSPDYPIPYDGLPTEWRSFNYVFMVIYKPEQETELMGLLGELADDTVSDRLAYENATKEINNTTGADLFFAWFNRGTSMVQLQDYAGAADSYDRAFQIYAQLPENQRPWRMLWYQTGPYFAYYYAGRYQDVINLATLTIDTATEPYLEESFYWRARAYIAAGQNQKAIDDLRTSLEYHQDFLPSISLMQELGISP
jgi:hypothetical protein